MNQPIKFDRELVKFHEDTIFLDIHMHGQDLYPVFVQKLSRCFPFKFLFPPLKPLSRLYHGNVNGGTLCVVGDHPFNLFQDSTAFLRTLAEELKKLEKDVKLSNGKIPYNIKQLSRALITDQLVFIPGLEGLPPKFNSITDLEAIHQMGFRIITPVHLINNQIGTTSANYLQYWKKHPKTKGPRGLTSFGEQVIRKMNELGLIIDLAHADDATFDDIAGLSRHPLIVSHSGARKIQPFHRYLNDHQIRQIRSSGGVIGLWPMYYKGTGIKDKDAFKAHLQYLLNQAGEDHISIGTDLHGIPGFMKGYNGPEDAIALTKLLFETGLNENQIRKILGLNFIRIHDEIHK